MHNKLKYEPLKGILDREDSVASGNDLINKYSPYLKELVNYATHLIVGCQRSSTKIDGNHIGLISLYYQTIQYADAIEVMLSNACVPATAPLERSLQEATIYIEYMLQKDYDDRSVAWIVEYFLNLKHSIEKLDISTERGKDFHALIKAHKYGEFAKLANIDHDNNAATVEQVDRLLNDPKYEHIVAQFRTTGKKKIKKWYSVNNGPRTIKGVADKLNQSFEYQTTYNLLSDSVHSRKLHNCLVELQGKPSFVPMRYIARGNIEAICANVGALLLTATKLIASKLGEDESVTDKWMEIVNRHRPIFLTLY